MSTSSRVPAVLDYLVAKFTASTSLGAADPAVSIIDGPVPVDGPLPLALWVGCENPIDAANGEEIDSANSAQEWAALGRLARNEDIVVHCTAGAWTGDVDEGFSPLRLVVLDIVAAVEDIVRADTAAPVLFPNPGVATATWRQLPYQSGLQVFVPMQIIYRARIGG